MGLACASVTDTRDLLDLAEAAARAAGSLLRERFAEPAVGLSTKSSETDMVSDADRAAEAVIVDALRARRPRDAILGEEGGERDGDSGVMWVIDPLDGTINFLYGIPQWCVSIACEDPDGALAAVVFDPIRDELFAAARNAGATCNGVRIAVRDARNVGGALVSTGFSYRPDERAVAARVVERLLPRVADIRRFGAAALDLCWTAAGRYDAFYESPLERWDIAAGRLIAVEAGARVGSLPVIGDARDPAGAAREGLVVAAPGIFDELRVLLVDAFTDSQALERHE